MEGYMSKVSVLIPTRNEIFLSKTIDDIFNKARGEFEVVVYLDGYWPDPPLKERPGLVILHKDEKVGMRGGINAAANAATGKYLIKTDAHCMFEEGFDLVLKAECDENWVVVPRRKSLDAENWCIDYTNKKAPVDYHFLGWPWQKPNEIGMHGTVWNERARSRQHILLDDEMSSQGSCWCMTKNHFVNFLGGLSEVGYGDFVQEFQEIGNKTWLGGGQVKINKKTWYAHLHKGKRYGRGYFISQKKMIEGALYSTDFWMNNRWDKRVHDIEWLIDKFWPVPSWPENWKELPRIVSGYSRMA
jgi:glycosyltransferase involved in cell wall biosynthesis